MKISDIKSVLVASSLVVGSTFALPLEHWTFDTENAGVSFAGLVNSGLFETAWNLGGPSTMATDGAGRFAIKNHSGQTYRKLLPYASPLSSGGYRLEWDLASWNLDSAAVGSTLTFGAMSSASDSQSFVAALRLLVLDAFTARIQIFSHIGGGLAGSYRNVDASLANASGYTVAVEFDFDADTVTYYFNGVPTHQFTNFSGSQVETLQFHTTAGWSTASEVLIDEMVFSGEAIAAPVLAVDFNESQILGGIHYEYFDRGLDFSGSPKAKLPNYSGQPIYAGLKLDPINGKMTGDDGGSYTNAGSLSFVPPGASPGAKLQWNGPASHPSAGRYEEGDVSTGVFLFKKADFLNGMDSGTVFMHATNDTLSATVRLDAKEPARLKSGKFRWVVKDAGAFYISDEVVDMTADTGDVLLTDEALDLSWFAYYPEVSATAISNAASPTLQNIEALGFWMSATVLTNTGAHVYFNMRCTRFRAEASVAAVSPTSLWEDWLGGFDLGTSTGLLDDADGDMLDNLSEYAFGGDPSDGNDRGNFPRLAKLSGATNVMEYIYFERTDAEDRGLASILTVGTHLVYTNWVDGSSYEVGRGASGVSGFNAVTNWIPTDTQANQFIRLQIEFTP